MRVSGKVERKIYFYRVNVGVDDKGQPITFDPKEEFNVISNLPFSSDNSRYLLDDDGNAICGWVDKEDDPYHFRFGRIRRSSLPQLEQFGTLSDLPVPPDSGLVEQVHIVFFSNNIVGSEFNFHGPRLSRLGYYLRVKGNSPHPSINFETLLRHDVTSQIKRIGDIRLFDLRIRPSYISVIKEADQDLGSAFEANRKVFQNEDDGNEIQIVLHSGKSSRKLITEKIINVVRSIVGREDLITEASRFKLKGMNNETGRVEHIDLLHEQLISQKQILKLNEKSRALDTSDAYNAIHSAYDELREQIESAPSLT